MKKLSGSKFALIFVTTMLFLSGFAYAAIDEVNLNIRPNTSNAPIILDAVPACPDKLLGQLIYEHIGTEDEGFNILVQRLTEASLRGEPVYTSTFYFADENIVDGEGNNLAHTNNVDIYHSAAVGTFIELEAVPACPNELLAQMLADRRGNAYANDSCDILIQRLTDASLRGETVYVATFYFTDDGVVLGGDAAARNPFIFQRLRATAIFFANGVTWSLHNVDVPRAPTRIDHASAELTGLGLNFVLDRQVMSGRTVAPDETVHLHLFNFSNFPWSMASLGVTENGRHFPTVGVLAP